MGCACGQNRSRVVAHQQRHITGPAPSADAILASAPPRYVVVARRTATDGKRFATLTAAQDYARRSGGIVRQL